MSTRTSSLRRSGQANRFVVFVTNPLPFGILAAAGQATRGTLQTRGLAFAVGVGQYLAKGAVGKGFCRAIRVVDTQHFAVGFALQRGGLVQRVGDGDQVLPLIVAVVGAFARAVLEAINLSVDVPPQVLGLEVGIDNPCRSARRQSRGWRWQGDATSGAYDGRLHLT